MRYIRVRGARWRERMIAHWRAAALPLDTDVLMQYEYTYTKIEVRPWLNKTGKNSTWAQPRHKLKRKILAALLDVYDSWQKQLQELGRPYYLKIWLFEPDFSHSQVVCAIGDRIAYYERLFADRVHDKGNVPPYTGILPDRMAQYHWQCCVEYSVHYAVRPEDEPDYASRADFLGAQRWINKRLKGTYKEDMTPDGDVIYAFPDGYVWIGER